MLRSVGWLLIIEYCMNLNYLKDVAGGVGGHMGLL